MINRFHQCLLALSAALLLSGQAVLRAADGPAPSWPAPVVPKFADKTFIITDFGAVADGKTDTKASIDKAIQAAVDAGGGVVRVPKGQFLFTPFSLKSHVNLHLDAGAVLLLANDIAAYPKNSKAYIDGITAEDCTDIAITGPGTIDGQGQPWWEMYRKRNGVSPAGLTHRPQLIRFSKCTRLLIKDVTITNSPNFGLIPGACQDVIIENVTISAPDDSPHTDGIDPSGWNFRIAKCNISVGDDNIAIKPSGDSTGDKLSCENFLIEDCTFGHGHGLSIGGQTRGGLRNLIARNCTFTGSECGVRMKSSRGQGALVENCFYDNLTMKDVRCPIFLTSYYPKVPVNVESDDAQPIDSRTPIWRNIQISNVTSTGSNEAGRIVGLPEQPFEDIVITNFKATSKTAFEVFHVKSIKFVNCDVTVEKGPKLKSGNANVSGLQP